MDLKPKRKKYDYHLIISSFDLSKKFNIYCKKHKNISFNRQARSFLLKEGIDYRSPFYEVETAQRTLQDLIRIAKTPWLND